MNVFFISYIYKPATSSHPKPGLFETTTLTLLLTCLWIPLFMTFEPDSRWIPESPVFRNSWLRRFEIPDRCVFATLRLRKFKIPDHREFATPRLRRFKIPDHREFTTTGFRRFEIPQNRKCFAPEKHISRASLNSMFRGWRVFLNSPTLAPRGSGLTPMIRFHKNLRISVKNVTLGTSEGTRVTRKLCNGRPEARSWNYPPRPYK
jgi:hypothetical protein